MPSDSEKPIPPLNKAQPTTIEFDTEEPESAISSIDVDKTFKTPDTDEVRSAISTVLEAEKIKMAEGLKANFETLIQFGAKTGTELNAPENPKTNPLVENLYNFSRNRYAKGIANIKQIEALLRVFQSNLLGKYYLFLNEILNSEFYGLSACVVAIKFPELINALNKEDLIELFYYSRPIHKAFILQLIPYREDREEFAEEVMKILSNHPNRDVNVQIAAYKVLHKLGQLEETDTLIRIAMLNLRISFLALKKIQPLLGRNKEVVKTFMSTISLRHSDELSSNYALESLSSNSDDFVTKIILEIIKNSLIPEDYHYLIQKKRNLTFTLGLLEIILDKTTSGTTAMHLEDEVARYHPTEQLRLAAASTTDKKIQDYAQRLLEQRGVS